MFFFEDFKELTGKVRKQLQKLKRSPKEIKNLFGVYEAQKAQNSGEKSNYIIWITVQLIALKLKIQGYAKDTLPSRSKAKIQA